MDPAAVQVLLLKQKGCFLGDHIRYFLDIAYLTHYPDVCFMSGLSPRARLKCLGMDTSGDSSTLGLPSLGRREGGGWCNFPKSDPGLVVPSLIGIFMIHVDNTEPVPGPSSLRLLQTRSSVWLHLGQSSFCFHHGLPTLWLCLISSPTLLLLLSSSSLTLTSTIATPVC